MCVCGGGGVRFIVPVNLTELRLMCCADAGVDSDGMVLRVPRKWLMGCALCRPRLIDLT